MTTIKDVALEAEVSTATVSRYLNKKGYVSEASRKKIQAAIKKLHYQPNEIARSLTSKSSKLIGLIIPDITNPYFPQLVRGAQDAAHERGYLIVVGNSEGEIALNQQYKQFFINYNVSGVIKVDLDNTFQSFNCPIVSVDRIGQADVYGVMTDHQKAATMIVNELKKTSAKNIMLMSISQIESYDQRFRSLKSQLVEEGYHIIDYQVPNFQINKIEAVIKDILESYKTFDTFIALNDLYAIEFITQAKKLNINIPEDIQVIGYDGLEIGQYLTPKLTTIQQPSYEIGYEGANLLMDVMTGVEKSEHMIVTLEPEWIEGETLRRSFNG